MGDPLMQTGGSTNTTAGGVTSTSAGASTSTSTATGVSSTTGAGGFMASMGMASSSGGVPAGGMNFGGLQATTQPNGMGGQMSSSETVTTGGAAPGESGIFEGTVAAHNAARAAVGAMPPLPDLVWSDDLAEVAQDWADTLVSTQCGSISHRPNGDYGENIAAQSSRGLNTQFSGPDAVQAWVAELDCYGYGTIDGSETCNQQCVQSLNASGCGHYTQVVWRDTESVGCGYASCDNGGTTFEVIVCNYDPPGNFIGQSPY